MPVLDKSSFTRPSGPTSPPGSFSIALRARSIAAPPKNPLPFAPRSFPALIHVSSSNNSSAATCAAVFSAFP
jgi:hypothetical protein